MSETVGIVGVGLVGTALAQNLLKAGFDVVGYDIDKSRCDRLRSMGGRPAGSPADVGAAAPRVMLSLLTSDVVRDVVEGPDGLLAADTPPRTIVDTTTGDPDETAALAARLAGRGVAYLDATVAGSSRQVADRTGVFMVGGDADAFAACDDLFAALGGNARHLGGAGSGARAKLACNLVLGLNRLALAEGLVLAERLGLEPRGFLDLLRRTPAYSAAMDVKGEKMLRGDFAPAARLAQHRKDVALILDCAERVGQDLPLSAAHLAVLDAAIAAGDGDLDNAAVIRELRRRGRGPRA